MATNKPQRPPPPRGGSGGGGMGGTGGGVMGISFRSIEEEDEEELISFTGKFDRVVEEKHRSQQKEKAEKEKAEKEKAVKERAEKEKEKVEKEKVGDSEKGGEVGAKASLERAASFPSSLETRARRESLEEDKNSPTRKIGKQLSDYKERISGLKERITDTISRKLEEFSAESPAQSPSSSPDRETPRPADAKAGAGGGSVGQKDSQPIKAQTTMTVKPSAKTTVTSTKTTSASRAAPASRDGEDSEFVEPLEDNNSEEFMDVIEEHFGPEPAEDFTGQPSSNRCPPPQQSRKRSILERSSKTKSVGAATAPVSMATLMHSRSFESLDSSGHEPSSQNSEPLPRPHTLTPGGGEGSKGGGSNSPPEHSSGGWPVPLSLQHLGIAMLAVFVWLLLPLPSYVAGMVTGAVLTAACLQFYFWLMMPPTPRTPLEITPLADLPPLQPPELRPSTTGSGEYKGWMNELMDYKPDDYHIGQTHSVLVTLQGSSLRLQRPKTPVPKRAMWDEEITTSAFIHQRHLDVLGAKVWLAPTGLVPKRFWSKKYPICLQLHFRQPIESSVDPGTPEDNVEFEVVSKEKCVDTLYLFARTGREKEEWYRRLAAAAQGRSLPSHVAEVARCFNLPAVRHKRSSSDPALRQHRPLAAQENSTSSSPCPSPPSTHLRNASADLGTGGFAAPSGGGVAWQGGELLEFAHYMSRLMPAAQRPASPATSPLPSRNSSLGEMEDFAIGGEVPGWLAEQQLVWLNALAGRCLWDFLQSPMWTSRITEKLQRKLSKIHVPYFMEELKVTDIDPGCDIPVVRRAGHPYMDDRGLWLELDMLYAGGLKMTIETKINLMRLKKGKDVPASTSTTKTTQPHLRSPITDPDEEDSAESSTDEEEETVPVSEEGSALSSGGTSRKLMRYLDRITQSKYFQQATEIKYVRRAMEGVSNTPLLLTVELRHLAGTLAVNIPPPPSDRLWYGFRGNPKVSLVAKPKVGEREVTITHITEWIEKKLLIEFQRVIVLPNMDDLIVPTLMSGLPEDVTPPPSRATADTSNAAQDNPSSSSSSANHSSVSGSSKSSAATTTASYTTLPPASSSTTTQRPSPASSPALATKHGSSAPSRPV